MGHHYLNPTWAGNLTLDPLRPELMMYAERGNAVKLVVLVMLNDMWRTFGSWPRWTHGMRPQLSSRWLWCEAKTGCQGY